MIAILIVPVPCAKVSPIREVTGRTKQAGTSAKRGPLQGEEATEENCMGFQVRNPWSTLLASEKGCVVDRNLIVSVSR